MVEEFGDFLEWVEGTVVGIHQFGCWFGGRGFDNRDRFFQGLAATGLVVAAVFGMGFLGLAVLLVAVTLGSLGASVTG